MLTKEIVQNIIGEVKSRGDQALFDYALKFDKVRLNNLKISKEEIEEAYSGLDKDLITSLKIAQKNILKFSKSILKRKERPIATSLGVKCWREFRPIEQVGLYVPGGRAKYPSTVLMLGVLARLAGCQKIIMCCPPPIPAVTLVAAYLVGITEIFQVGGAQAIAALAYGTESIAPVYKIFGPGNAFVTEAKKQVSVDVAIDLPAGPSEVAILADETAKSKFVEADLESQLEHGSDSVAWLVTTSKELAKKVKVGQVKLVKNIGEGIKLINELAPEHLEIIVKNEKKVLSRITNAGSIFLGNYSPVPAGDYITGPNHTLPTGAWAKSCSALSVYDFGKMVEVQKVSQPGLKNVKNDIIRLAMAEGFTAHANSIRVRFKN